MSLILCTHRPGPAQRLAASLAAGKGARYPETSRSVLGKNSQVMKKYAFTSRQPELPKSNCLGMPSTCCPQPTKTILQQPSSYVHNERGTPYKPHVLVLGKPSCSGHVPRSKLGHKTGPGPWLATVAHSCQPKAVKLLMLRGLLQATSLGPPPRKYTQVHPFLPEGVPAQQAARCQAG